MRLKNYVFFREAETGVWFDAGRRSFALNGKGIYPLVERLLNALETSGRSPDALVAELPEKLREFAQRLFGELARHEMLQRGTVADADRGQHAPYVEFLKYLEDNLDDSSLEEALARWRAATIAVVGDGYAAKAAAGVLADSGCGRLLLRCTSTDDVGLDEFDLSLRDRGGSGVDLSAGEFDPASIAAVADGLVIAAGERLHVDDAIAYARAARDAGLTVCAGLPVNGQLAVLGMAADDMPGIADLADWLLPPAVPVTPSPVNLAIAGSIAAQEMIARFFGIDSIGHAAARIVSPYSEVGVCPVPPSPRRHAADAILRTPDASARVEMPDERELSPYERLRLSLAPWTDPALRVLGTDLPEALPQLPLYHEAFAVRQPGTARDSVQVVVGWGLSPEEAGLRAAMNAIALMAVQEFGADHPLVAGLGEEEWRAAAFAQAFVRHGRFREQAVWGTFSAEEIDDPAARVMLQILRFQVQAPLVFRAGFVPGVEAVVVSCQAGDECLSCVCRPALLDAIRDSIGLAISKLQLRAIERIVRPDEIALAEAAGVASLVGLDAIARAGSAAMDVVPASFVQSRRLGLPQDVTCGYAVVEEAA